MRLMFTNQNTREVFADKSFEEFSRLMYETARGSISDGLSIKEANDKIREIEFEILGIDANAKPKEIRRAIRRHQLDIYEVHEDVLQDLVKTGWGENPFFTEFVEIRNLEDGDTNEFWVADDVYLTVAEFSGNHHDLFRQRLGSGQVFTIKTAWYGAKFYVEYEHYLNGKVDWSGMIQKIYAAFDKKVNDMVYSALFNIASALTPAGVFNKTGNLVRADVLELIENVQAATGNEVVIMGTKTALGALDAIGDASWRSNEMKQEMYTTGRLGYWEGVRKVEIPQSFKPGDLTQKQVDNDILLFMPVDPNNKPIKLVNEGQARIFEDTDPNTNMDMTLEWEYQQKLGVGVVIGKKFGIWDMTP